jgi:acetyl-CoA acyltransferase
VARSTADTSSTGRRAALVARQSKSVGARVQSFRGLGLADLPPVAPSITETSTGLSMGQSAELMAKLNGISRADQDAWALGSHRKAAAAWEDGRMAEEVAPVFIVDNGVRDSDGARPGGIEAE